VTLQGCRDPALMRSPERFDPAPAVIGADSSGLSRVQGLGDSRHPQTDTC
jgi:hypothetical protein